MANPHHPATVVRGVAFHCLVGFFLIAVGPRLTEISTTLMKRPEAAVPWFGTLIIAVIVIELFAFPTKLRMIHGRGTERMPEGTLVFFLWMFHALISVLLLIIALKAFSPLIPTDQLLSGWRMVGIFAMVMKELYFLFIVLAPPEEPPKPGRIPEWLVDFALLVYASITYSLVWKSIASGNSIGPLNSVMGWLDLSLASLLFLIFYLPLRIPYWIEEWSEARSATARIALFVGVLAVLIPAIWIL